MQSDEVVAGLWDVGGLGMPWRAGVAIGCRCPMRIRNDQVFADDDRGASY